MGAADFDSRATGKTVDEAFRTARDAAAWEYGHGGYTGTIAEKGTFVEFVPPEGVPVEDVIYAISQGRGSVRRRPDGTWEDYVPPAPEWAHRLKEKSPTWGKHNAWKYALEIYSDKWGPALAIRTGPNEWVFFGVASC